MAHVCKLCRGADRHGIEVKSVDIQGCIICFCGFKLCKTCNSISDKVLTQQNFPYLIHTKMFYNYCILYMIL